MRDITLLITASIHLLEEKYLKMILLLSPISNIHILNISSINNRIKFLLKEMKQIVDLIEVRRPKI